MTARSAADVEHEHFLVTGASGALGAWTVKTLLEQRVAVTALCRSADDRCLRLVADPEHLTALRRVDSNDLDFDQLLSVMRDVTHVVHTDPTLTAVEVAPTADVSRASIARLDGVLHAAHVAGVIGLAFESSMATFAPGPTAVGSDESPAPADPLGCVHLAREMVAAHWHARYGMPSTGLRVGAVYGAGHDIGPTGLVARAVAAAIDNRVHLLGNQVAVDFQFIGDVATALCDAARVGGGHRVLNLSCAVSSTTQFQRVLTALTGASCVEVGGPIAAVRVVEPDAVGDAIGYLPTGLDGGLRETIESMRWAPRDLATESTGPV